MNVEFPKIMSNLKLGEVGARQTDNVDKITENAAKQLFSDSLTIKESENFALGDGDIRGEYGERSLGSGAEDENMRPPACEAGANFTAGDGDGSVENRKRKFNVMMQQFRM